MISVIVCTYNRSASLENALRSFEKMRGPEGTDWELIVVDNNSTDDTAEVVRRFVLAGKMNVRYLFENAPGLSQARNAGIRAAEGDIVAFTDDDITADPRWVSAIAEAFRRFNCAAVGGRIVPVWSCAKPRWIDASVSPPLRSGAIVAFERGDDPFELNAPFFGANMAFRKTVFESCGLFRTDLGKCGTDPMNGEDTEFCLRLLQSQQKIVYFPIAIICHPVPRSNLRRQVQNHYFGCGRYAVRLEPFPESAFLWLGVPRYLFRRLFAQAWRWFFSFGSRRFRQKLQVCESLGSIFEARRMSREARPIERSELTVGVRE